MIDTTTGFIVIAGAAVFLFGGGALTKWARSFGRARRVYEQAVKGEPESEKA